MAFFLCVLFLGTVLRNGAAASSGNGHFAQQQLPGYFTYGGGPNDDTRRMDSESDQRRQQQLGRASRRHSSDLFSQQRPQMSDHQQRKPGGWSFGEKDKCQERCELDCFTFPFTDMGDTIKEFEQPRLIWICTQLKPPSRPFHEKIVNHVTNASLFEYVIFGVVLMAVIVCFVCGCYQCCCRQNPHDGRHSSRSFIEERNTDCSNFANHFGAQTKSNHVGSAGTNTERESLTNGGATQIGDGLIHPTPLSSSGKNGGPPLSFGRPPQHQSHTFAVGPNDQSAI